MELQQSLAALNHGEVDTLATPNKKKKQGRPFSLQKWKYETLMQVRYRIGQGVKKYVVLEEIGNAIGQSPETIRSWEKTLKKDPDIEFAMWLGEICGQYEEAIKERDFDKIPDEIRYEFNRNQNVEDLAAYYLRSIKSKKLTQIKDKLREYRLKYKALSGI